MRPGRVGTSILAALSLGLAVAAHAATQTLTVTASPSKAGTQAVPAPTGITLQLALTGTRPKPMKQIVVYFDKNIRFNGTTLPDCGLDSPCDAGKRIGTGAFLVAFYSGSKQSGKPISDRLNVYNAIRGKHVLIIAESPRVQLDGRLAGASGPYATKLTIDVPYATRKPLPGVTTPIIRLRFTLRGDLVGDDGVRRPYLTLAGCPAGGLHFKTVTAFDGAHSQTHTTTAPCSSG
jgi:hypothetical protein